MNPDDAAALVREAKAIRDHVVTNGVFQNMNAEMLAIALLARIDRKLGRLLGDET